ncbi:MAG TPA: ABC transporter permease [Nocardia sp.]|uniref:ABC transporter permease n=1 Tax=Nocardia sp. TaxID=1821 RepID=UPI002B4B2847|nr:ABC transporter permease [Nocardia sp.]HLS79037.1 ABC transporter permease [Nocardia sp.]
MTTLLPRELLLPLTAELRKVLTLRWCVLLAALLPAIALVAATVTALMAGQADPRAQPVTGAATIGLLLAIAAAALGAGSFAAALTGGEFRYGTMPVTVLTAPDRDRLVGAKLLVAAALALAVGVVTELVALGCLFAFGRDKVTFDGTLWAVLGAGLFATVCWALIGTGLGLLLRNSTTAVTALLGWLLIGEPLIWLIAEGLGIGGLVTLLPGSATVGAVAVGSFQDAAVFAPTPAALVVLLSWAVASAGAGWWLLREREV